MSEVDRDRISREQRWEALHLPMVPLRHHMLVATSTLSLDSVLARRGRWPAVATGIGPDGVGIAAWRAIDGLAHFVARDARDLTQVSEIVTDLRIDFIQPLPEGRVLIVSGRTRERTPNAEVWSAEGELLARACIGDAVSQVLATTTGSIWVGYSDEALSSKGPEYGFARFDQELVPAWLYSPVEPVTNIYDVMAMNVVGETAYVCAYKSFHLVSVTDSQMIDFGLAPVTNTVGLLVQGTRVVFLGGDIGTSAYDLLASARVVPDGIVLDGPPRRLVRPNGIEIWRRRTICRGPVMHLLVDNMWFVTSLDEVHSGDGARPNELGARD